MKSFRIPDTMRAARYEVAGSEAGVIRVDEVPTPVPSRGEVLVEVIVSGVNPTDWKARANIPQALGDWITPNQDGAGVIVAVGEGVATERVGQRVWIWQAAWQRTTGTAAEYTVVPSAQAVELPVGSSFDLGAGLGIPAMTAAHSLFAAGPLGRDHQVLVHGGAGAVGHAAIQLARNVGARVATTVSTPDKAGLAAAAGAELVIDYTRDDVARQVRDWAPDGVARIVEVDLGRNISVDTAVIAPGGSIFVYARTEQPIEPGWDLMVANASITFVLIYTISAAGKQVAVDAITHALQSNALSALPATRFTLDDTAQAHDAVRDGAIGKVLIDVPAKT